jgi:hypothetical protein
MLPTKYSGHKSRGQHRTPAVLPPVLSYRRRESATHRKSFRRENGHAHTTGLCNVISRLHPQPDGRTAPGLRQAGAWDNSVRRKIRLDGILLPRNFSSRCGSQSCAQTRRSGSGRRTTGHHTLFAFCGRQPAANCRHSDPRRALAASFISRRYRYRRSTLPQAPDERLSGGATG